MVTTSVKIPAHVKEGVAAAAAEAGVTVHAWLLQVIEQATARAAMRRAFVESALAARERFKRTGLAVPAGEVDAYFAARSKGLTPSRPKAVKWRR